MDCVLTFTIKTSHSETLGDGREALIVDTIEVTELGASAEGVGVHLPSLVGALALALGKFDA